VYSKEYVFPILFLLLLILFPIASKFLLSQNITFVVEIPYT
jgi:hypothetical protein